MSDGINIIRYIFGKFLDVLFNSFNISNNVSIGWIMVSFFIISIMISNILSIAKSSQSHKFEKGENNG